MAVESDYGAPLARSHPLSSAKGAWGSLTQPTTDPTEFVTFQTDCFDNQQLFLAKFCRKKSVLRQKLRRYQAYLKMSILLLPAALGRAVAKLPKFIELSDCQSGLYANNEINLVL